MSSALLVAATSGCATGTDGPSAAIGAGGAAADGPNGDARFGFRSSSYTRTHYPIVLAHGMGGWQKLFGVLDYFYGIPSALQSGGARVYVTHVSQFASSELRGEQLLEQIEYIAAASGAGKVNLIAHSQGGLDARYVLAARPDLLASVTTVATPHQGAAAADWLADHVTDGGFSEAVFEYLGNAAGFLLDLLAGTDQPQDAVAAVEQVTTSAMADFNARYPMGLPSTACGSGPDSVDGIRFYSWGGTSSLTNVLDPSDAPFAVIKVLSGENSDGLVGRCSSHFGHVVRDNYGMNHLDEVNQVLGLVSWFETSPVEVFRQQANRLKNDGL